MVSRVWHALVRVFGAVVIGTATIFVMKADPREHWAIAPTPKVVLVVEDARAGLPPELLGLAMPACV